MKQNKGFVLKTIDQTTYLLPYGQNIADHKRGLSLNDTGIFLWKALETSVTKEALVQQLMSYYQVSSSQKDAVMCDVEYFLRTLSAFGAINPEADAFGDFSSETIRLCIGGLFVQLQGPKEAFSADFLPFQTTENVPFDLTVRLHLGQPSIKENGMLLLRNKELFVCERTTDYLLLFPMADQIVEAHLTKDGSFMDIYCVPPYGEAFIYDLFHCIRLGFLYTAQTRQMFAVHSASILYQDRLWVFSAPSGGGKSTHTALWNTLYGTSVINGDLNLLAITDDGPIVHGMPWCGTSQISSTKSYPLGGIVFLKQGQDNLLSELPAHKKSLLLTQRLISPGWTKELLSQNVDFASTLTSQVPCCSFHCTKEPDAVHTMKQWMDAQWK